MRFFAIVFAVVFVGVGVSFMTFMDETFGKPYGELSVIGITAAGVLLAIYVIIKVKIHNKKVLKASADIARAAENAHRKKSSKDWV